MDNLDKQMKNFTVNYESVLKELISRKKPVSSPDLTALREEIYEILITTTNRLLDELPGQNGETDSPPEHIEADTVTLEVIDKHTGKLYRRCLPLEYSETDNGLTLSGENLSGETSQIAFLSEAAVQKITDITGRGLDKPRCD